MDTKKRLFICRVGCAFLHTFLLTCAIAIGVILPGLLGKYASHGTLFEEPGYWIVVCLLVIMVEATIFWIGIIIVYLTCSQLGINLRVWGVILGFIPIANLVMLFIILTTASREIRFESEKLRINEARKNEQICKTKYPLLLVHGVFFRDFKMLNYWGRVPKELENNGATIYYGKHNSASPVRDSAKELEARIKEIVEKTGCEKVNVIAHSKGGLDTRAAIALTDAGKYIASLTTINTPHRGCEFADYLLEKIPEDKQLLIANTYNKAAEDLGDINPDFLAAVHDLTHSSCTAFNEEIKDDPGIYYQSFGSKINKCGHGKFPLNYTSYLVKYFDGPNDGLVGEKSFKWGQDYTFVEIKDRRGISHGDMIDLNRENHKGFDVREFYVNIVDGLRRKGF